MQLRRIAHSLLTRLILLGVLIVIVGAVVRYTLLTNFLEEDLQRVVSAQQLALAETVARDVDYKIEERRRVLEQLAQSLPAELLARPEQLRAWLKERHDLHPLFSLGLMVADTRGTVLADYPALPGRAGMSIASHPDFHFLLEGRFGVARPELGQASRQPVLPMGAPLRGRNGQVRGVLVGITALDAPNFLDRVTQGRIGQGGGFLLISPRDRLFVAASIPGMALTPTPAEGINPLQDRAMAGYRGTGKTLNAQGVEEISGIASVPGAGWFVVARLPAAEALATVARAQTYVIRHGVTASVVVLLLAGTLIVWMLRPLYRAADQAERMTRGELPLQALPVERDDEVGHLTAAFNRLLAKLAGTQEELARMVHIDPLTGLPNRSLLADRMHQAQAGARRHGTRLAVLFLDLDGFKQINDQHGHAAGDAVLREIAHRLKAVVREADTLARIGGDEFVLLAADLGEHPEESARTLAAKCIKAVAKPVHLEKVACSLGVSIGVALCSGHCEVDRILMAADQAMYRAKQRGRGCYEMAPEVEAEAS